MKKRVLQDVKIGVFALCFVFAAVLTVLAFLPEGGDVTVAGKFHASSVPVSLADQTEQILASGTLRNGSDRTVTVERLELDVKGLEQPLVLQNIALPPRTDLPLSLSVVSTGSADRVTSVRVTVDGKTRELRNPAVTDAFAYAVLPLALTILFAALTAHAAIVRVYLRQKTDVADSPADNTAG